MSRSAAAIRSAQLAEMILAVEHHEDLPARVSDPAQLTSRFQRFGDVVEHVHGQRQAAGVVQLVVLAITAGCQ